MKVTQVLKVQTRSPESLLLGLGSCFHVALSPGPQTFAIEKELSILALRTHDSFSPQIVLNSV